MNRLVSKIVLGIIVLLFVLVAVFFFRPPELVVVGFDSELNAEQRRALLDKFRHEVDCPADATNLCFRLEPALYKNGDVYGEYVRFGAASNVIQQFMKEQFPGKDPTPKPLPYSRWHFGVGNYPWWKPMSITNATYFEDGRKFATIDWESSVVFYSYVRSYSQLGAKGYD